MIDGESAGETVAETKARLRREMRERLGMMDPEAARAAAGRLVDRVTELPEIRDARHVMVCLSFGVEIDTWGLVDRWLADGRRVYVPRAEHRDRRLRVHPYPCPLRTLSFGLRQPTPDAPELAPDEIDGRLDAALILGLAFDRRGVRLGYGAGFFDRFLAGRPFPKIGLAFEIQVLEHLPFEPHDVPMDRVVSA